MQSHDDFSDTTHNEIAHRQIIKWIMVDITVHGVSAPDLIHNEIIEIINTITRRLLRHHAQ